MKKLFISVMMAVCSLGQAMAQPMGVYDLKYEKSSYQEINDGTAVPFSLENEAFDRVLFDGSNTPNTQSFKGVQGYPIGFDFKFDNKYMNQFAIGSNGYIVLGRDEVSAEIPSGNCSMLFDMDMYKDFIGVSTMMNVMYSDSTEISYKTEGAEGSRILTVQYKNILYKAAWKDVPSAVADFQFRLYEATGAVSVCFNDWKQIEGSEMASSTLVGVKGSVEKDFLVAAGDFNAPTAAVSANNKMMWNKTAYPEDGMLYTFFPPEDCAAPAVQPANLKLSAGSDFVKGSFDVAEGADHYLVLIGTEKELTEMPQDNVYYKAGEVIGNATVVSFGIGGEFATENTLGASATYYINVFAVNSNCMFGPKYNVNGQLSASVNTLAKEPAEIKVVDTGLDFMNLSVKANENNNDVMIAMTDVSAVTRFHDILDYGQFGTPTGALAVGDSIDGGGCVVYKGAAKDIIKIENLKEGAVCHFMAWSVDAEGNVSTNGIMVSSVTMSNVPWSPVIKDMPPFKTPIGWTSDGTWSKDKNADELLADIKCNDKTAGVESFLETPGIVLAEGENRIIFNINMNQFAGRNIVPYEFADGDKFMVQVTENGTDYETIYEMNKDNAPEFKDFGEFVKYYLPFKYCAGKTARIRFKAHMHSTLQIFIQDIRVEKKSECDYPVDLRVNEESVTGRTLELQWTAQSEESMWEVNYKEASVQEWSEPIMAKNTSCTINGLRPEASYEVRVRAYRSEEVKSEWSEVLKFKNSIGVPFDIDFAADEKLPLGWSFKRGELTDSTALSESPCWRINANYRGTEVVYTAPDDGIVNDWLVSPKFNVQDKYVKHLLNVQLQKSRPSAGGDAVINIVVAKGDEAFKKENIIYTIEEKDMSKRFAIDTLLVGYEGDVRIGLYIATKNGTGLNIKLNTMSLKYSCVNDIVTKVSNITETSAQVDWEGSAEEVLYFCRENGNRDRDFTKTTEKTIKLENLKPHTLYEFGITKMCEAGDTAVVKIDQILTLGKVVPMVENVKVEPAKYSAKITWDGEGYAFNVKYKKHEANEWLRENTKDKFIVLTNLEDNTVYDYAIQTQGTEIESDSSEYTPVAQFTTLKETCFYPEDIVVEPSYFTAIVSWKDNGSYTYEVSYTIAGKEEWVSMETQEAELMLEGLAEKTDYKLRLRSKNEAGDSSRWSPMVDFTTTAVPECITPTDLEVKDLTYNSALLTWTSHEGNIMWNIKYRRGDEYEWTEDQNITETSYAVNNLVADATYIWRVQAECADKIYSKWSSQNKFVTLTDDIKQVEFSGLDIIVKDGMISVINPYNAEIRTINCYDLSGSMLKSYQVNATDNVFVRTSVRGAVIIKIEGDNVSKVKKINVK